MDTDSNSMQEGSCVQQQLAACFSIRRWSKCIVKLHGKGIDMTDMLYSCIRVERKHILDACFQNVSFNGLLRIIGFKEEAVA